MNKQINVLELCSSDTSISVQSFKQIHRFLLKYSRGFIDLNQSIIEPERCPLHQNCLEFWQNFIGNVFSGLCLQNTCIMTVKLVPYWLLMPLELIGSMWWPTVRGGGGILHHICQFRYYTFGQYFDNLSTAYKTCYDNDNLKKKFSM